MLRRGIVAVAQGKEAVMAVVWQHTPEITAGSVRDIVTWYNHATDGATVVIRRAVPPAIWLVRRPHHLVYWWTEGGRGLTVSVGDARQRLAMVLAQAPCS